MEALRDPFPLAPIPWLSEWIRPVANRFGLVILPMHIHEVVYSAGFYFFAQHVISPILSNMFAAKYYSHLSRKKKINWDVHVVSLFQSVMISVLALWVMFTDEERMNMDREGRLWGYTGSCGLIAGLAVGYFVWDLVVTSLNLDVFGIGALAHAISALTAFSLGFRPFVNYYACNFILWEISTPFLNIHWFLDKVNMTGTKTQLYNGFLLLFSFFSSRLAFGNYSAIKVFSDIYYTLGKTPSTPGEGVQIFVTKDTTLPTWLALSYVTSNAVLTTLNVYWFFMMIKAVRKRFTPGTESPDKAGKVEKVVATEVEIDVSATGSVMLNAQDVRSRRV